MAGMKNPNDHAEPTKVDKKSKNNEDKINEIEKYYPSLIVKTKHLSTYNTIFSSIVKQAVLVYVNHTRSCSLDNPVLSNECKSYCAK